jgi:hemin uptake protein HemP
LTRRPGEFAIVRAAWKAEFDSSNENGYHLSMQSGRQKKSTSNQRPELSFEGGWVMSTQLLGERGELIIEHDGREYRLRLTQNRKLILTA